MIPAISYPQAIASLAPGASWVIEGADLTGLRWISGQRPTDAEIEAEIVRLINVAEEAAATAQATRESAIAKLEELGLTIEEFLALTNP